ncbi:MAG: hypothetical protein GWN58_31290 [Anaerolineae bacterium]|nr:hypothetical protein [Anaerolineae bacterium]
MLPLGHVAYTWAALAWMQSRGQATDIDYRGAAVAALLPDLIDKPLTLTLMSGSGTSQGPGHTLLGQALLATATAELKPEWLPYALISGSHLFADQMWKYPRTLFFPFSGRLDSWKFMGTPSAMLDAYAEIATRPEIVAVEAVGLVLFGWLVCKHRLFRRGPLKRFLHTGRTDRSLAGDDPSDAQSQEVRARTCA